MHLAEHELQLVQNDNLLKAIPNLVRSFLETQINESYSLFVRMKSTENYEDALKEI